MYFKAFSCRSSTVFRYHVEDSSPYGESYVVLASVVPINAAIETMDSVVANSTTDITLMVVQSTSNDRRLQDEEYLPAHKG